MHGLHLYSSWVGAAHSAIHAQRLQLSRQREELVHPGIFSSFGAAKTQK